MSQIRHAFTAWRTANCCEDVLIRRTHGDRYVRLHMQLLACDRWRGTAWWDTLPITFSWLGHYGSSVGGSEGPSDWYAARVEVVCSPHTFAAHAALAARITRSIENDSPQAMVDRFTALHMPFMVMDGRPDQGRYALPERQLGPEYRGYMPDYRRLGWDSCHVTCTARDEESAQRMLLKHLADQADGGEHAVRRVAQFLAAGMPVLVRDDHVRHDRLADLILTPAEKHAALAA